MNKEHNQDTGIAAVAFLTGATVQALPVTSQSSAIAHAAVHVPGAIFRDDFTAFNKDHWRCEYDCPLIEDEKARFRLRSGVAPNNYGSWSKARYKPQRFTFGRFTTRFSLTERPAEKVWWGVALWDDGLADDGSEFNEINFGYTTDQSYTNTHLRFESARRGKYESLKVDVGVDLYDGQYHTAVLDYNQDRVQLWFDDKMVKEISNKDVIPTDPMDFILGPRLVTGGKPMAKGFTESVDWVEIAA